MHPILKKLSFIGGTSKKRFWLIFISLILFLLISGGGFWFFQIRKSSLTYAVTNINSALESNNFTLLNTYVDFSLISENFVQNIIQYWPDIEITDIRKKELEQTVKQTIFDAFKDEEKESSSKSKKDVSAKASVVFTFLPKDFLEQLKTKKIVVYRQEKDFAILSVPIIYEDAGYDIELKLLAQKCSDKWSVTRIINGYSIIQMHMGVLDQKFNQVKQSIADRNIRTRSQMSKYYYVERCNVVLGKQKSQETDIPLTILVEGVNIGKKALSNAGMQCLLYAPDGTVLTVLPLNTVKEVLPSDTFEQEWYVELPESLLGPFLMSIQEKPLTCSIELTMVTLENGTFFSLIPMPKEERIHP